MSQTRMHRLRRSFRPREGLAMLGCLLALIAGGADLLQRLQAWQTQPGADPRQAGTTQNGGANPQDRADLRGSSDMITATSVPPPPSLSVAVVSAADTALFSISADEPPLPVNDRFAIFPTYSAKGYFLGYQVQGRSGDSRFAHGDIISAINGQAVEDSAAGSELLLIAMAQASAQIATRARDSVDH